MAGICTKTSAKKWHRKRKRNLIGKRGPEPSTRSSMRGVARPGSIRETGAGNERGQNPRTAKEFVTWRARGDGFNLAAQATQTATSAPLQVRGSRGQDDGSGVLDQSNLGRTVSQQRDRKGRFAGKAKPRYPRTHMQ